MVQGDRVIQGDCDTGWKHDDPIYFFFLIFSLEMSWSRVCVDLAHHSRFFAWKKVYEGGGGGVFGSGGAEGFSSSS